MHGTVTTALNQPPARLMNQSHLSIPILITPTESTFLGDTRTMARQQWFIITTIAVINDTGCVASVEVIRRLLFVIISP